MTATMERTPTVLSATTLTGDKVVNFQKEDLGKIFNKFVQSGDPSQPKIKKSGTGLGLSISKNIVDMHGGKIWAESEIGKGSKFVFELPKQRA